MQVILQNLKEDNLKCSSGPREHLVGEDVVFPELSAGGDDPVVMDFLLLTQANHTIYDYGSFGFWGAVLAGGTTMLADGYRFPLFNPSTQLLGFTNFLQREA